MLKKIESLVFMSCLVLGAMFFWSLPCEANWIKTYGGTGSEYMYSIQQTSDGGYIVAGETSSFGAGNTDAWLLKLNADGVIEWQKAYGGAGSEYMYSIQQTSDGGYIVAGETNSSGAGDSDAWLLKLNENGTVQWQKTYGGAGYDYFASVRQIGTEYFVAGMTSSFGAGDNDVWLLKINGDGIVTWQKTYGGTGYDYASLFQQTSDGGYIVAGGTQSFGATWMDFWLLKLDGDLNVQWQNRYGGPLHDYLSSMKQVSDGGYILVGRTSSFGTNYTYDGWILKLTGNGNIEWQKTYGGAANDILISVEQTADGGYIAAGRTDSFGSGIGGAWLLKLDATGVITWQRAYGGTRDDSISSVQQKGDGGYVAAGHTGSFGTGETDIWLMTLDESGSTISCPFEGISTAAGVDTTIAPIQTAVISDTTSVTGVDTTVVPVDSTTTSSEICPFSSDLLLKVGATKKRQGEGTVTSFDGLISCPDACQIEYTQRFKVTLLATPSALSTFMGWKPSSLGCIGADPCQVTMDKKKSVKAIFQGPNKLKVVTTLKNGATGTVASVDTFINCPNDCEETYILNASVTLTANAGVGSTFVKWTGKPCKDETTNVCTFTMEKNATVKAIFAPTS
jgi:hypothetical protein